MSRSYFYYLRDDNNAPMGTICFIVSKHGWSRGVALVNRKMGDFPCKKVGRQIAEGRAIQALCRGESTLRLRDEYQLGGGAEQLYKSHFKPTLLTEPEGKFMARKEHE